MRNLIPHYPAFRGELLRRRANTVRPFPTNITKLLACYADKVDFFPNVTNFKASILNKFRGIEGKPARWEDLEEVYNKENSGSNIFEINKETKIIFRAIQILDNIKKDDYAKKHFFSELNKLQRHLEPNNKDQSLNWLNIIDKIGSLYLSDKDDESREVRDYSNNKIDFEYNWRINDLLESTNLIWLTRDIRNVENDVYKDIRFYYNNLVAKDKKDEILLEELNNNYGRCLQLENANDVFLKPNYIRNKVGLLIERQKGRWVKEIRYYINATKGNLKRFNDRLNSRVPTDFKTYNLRNSTLINIFKSEKYKFSSRFRHILTEIGEFLEKHYESSLIKGEFTEFNKLIDYVRLNLEEVSFGQYSLLGEYLHSKGFTEVTDKLQIYGGSFGIYDFEEKHLVRIQDSKYSEPKYRPNVYNHKSKWYDLPERIKNMDGIWVANTYKESVDLMFLAQSILEQNPFFYTNLTKDSNYLNELEREHIGFFCEDGEISAFVLIDRLLNSLSDTYFTCLEHLGSKALDKIEIENQLSFNSFSELREKMNFKNIFDEPTRSDIYTSLIGILYPDIYFSNLIFQYDFSENHDQDLIRLISQIPNFGKIIPKFLNFFEEKDQDLNLGTLFFCFQWFNFYFHLFESCIVDKRSSQDKEKYDFITNYLKSILKINDGQTKDSKPNYEINLLHVIVSIQIKLCLCEKYVHSPFFRESALDLIDRDKIVAFFSKIFKKKELIKRIEEKEKELQNASLKDASDINKVLLQLKNKLTRIEKLERKLIPQNQTDKLGNFFKEKFGYFVIFYKGYLKVILKNLFKGFNFNKHGHAHQLNIRFQAQDVPDELKNLAYDPTEWLALKEKFYNNREERILKDKVKNNISSFFSDLNTQGLIHYEENKINWLDLNNLIVISERYVNLCKFVQRELNDEMRSFKIRCDFPTEYCPDINQEKYFIDKQLGKLEVAIQELEEESKKLSEIDEKEINKLNKDLLEMEQQMRQLFLLEIENNIQKVASSNYLEEKSLPIRDIEEQISSILTLLVESVQSFHAASGKDAEFLRIFEEFNILEKEQKQKGKNISNGLLKKQKESREKITKISHKYIKRISTFDVAANFIWRANNYFAFSQLILPLASTSVTNKEQSTIGFLMLGFRNIIRDSQGNYIHITHDKVEEFKELFYTIRQIYQPLVHPYMDAIFHKGMANDSVIKSATRAGISRVMARNLAHNIGSHVLGRLSNNEDYKGNKYWLLRSFIRYLRDRTSFIADVSLGIPSSNVSVPFKSAVLNKFIPNFKNSKQKNLKRDENSEFQLILLDYISGLPKYSWEKNIEITPSESGKRKSNVISLPNDQFGAHAIYIIFENIIRNSFKHDPIRTSEKLILTIDIDDYVHNEHLKKITITDNLGQKAESRKERGFLDKFKKKMAKNILDSETKTLRRDDWGILEMKIAAAYLREIDPVKIDNFQFSKNNPKIFDVNFKSGKEESKDLEFSFYVQKSKELEIVADQKNYKLIEKILKEEKFVSEGIKLVSYEEQKDNMESKNSTFGKSSYKLILYVIEESLNVPFAKSRNCRIVHQKKIADIKAWFIDRDTLLFECWKSYHNNFLKTYGLFESNKEPIIILNHDREDEEKSAVISSLMTCICTNTSFASIKENYQKVIYFDDHTDALNSGYLKLEEKEACLYYEPYKSYHATTFLIKSIKSSSPSAILRRKRLKFELVESALTKIVVLDERVQNEVYHEKEKLHEKFEEYAAMNIFIPIQEESPQKDEGLDLSKQYINQSKKYTKKLTTWVKKYSNDSPLPFVIIHINLIEKIQNRRDQATVKQFCEYIANEIDRENPPSIVLTSGRGTPSNRPENIPFVPYSTLARYLYEGESRCKYDLVKILYSANMSSTGLLK